VRRRPHSVIVHLGNTMKTHNMNAVIIAAFLMLVGNACGCTNCLVDFRFNAWAVPADGQLPATCITWTVTVDGTPHRLGCAAGLLLPPDPDIATTSSQPPCDSLSIRDGIDAMTIQLETEDGRVYSTDCLQTSSSNSSADDCHGATYACTGDGAQTHEFTYR